MQVGLVGWRGMVGSVLMQRMIAEKDFKDISPVFFSTSQAGEVVTMRDGREVMLKNANDQDHPDEERAALSSGGAGKMFLIWSMRRCCFAVIPRPEA